MRAQPRESIPTYRRKFQQLDSYDAAEAEGKGWSYIDLEWVS
jgi:hypothetical protein